MEPPRNTRNIDTYPNYSMGGLDITYDLSELGRQFNEGAIDQATYDTQLAQLAGQSLSYLTEGMRRFPEDFDLDMEAGTFARSLSAERRQDFALQFNELLYASISDPLRAHEAFSNTGRLQQAIDLIAITDRIYADYTDHLYEQPIKVRELGDAIIGRVVLNMLSFDMDLRILRIPKRR